MKNTSHPKNIPSFFIFLFFVIFPVLGNAVRYTDGSERIKIITPEWEYYTQRDGNGLYHELFQEIFMSAGIELHITYAPTNRCYVEVKKKRFDAHPGVYKEDKDFIISKWPLGIDIFSAVHKNDTIGEWKNQETIRNKKVAWERGYLLDQIGIVTVPVISVEFDHLEYAVNMMVNDRIDVILDYHKAISKVISMYQLGEEVTIQKNIIQGQKYYMGFAKSDKGRELAYIWDRGIKRLYQSGELHGLYKKYNETLILPTQKINRHLLSQPF